MGKNQWCVLGQAQKYALICQSHELKGFLSITYEVWADAMRAQSTTGSCELTSPKYIF